MSIVATQIAAEIATLAREVAIPLPPLGYGTDLWCQDDIRESAEDVTGRLLLAQSNYRRVTTDRGSLPDDPDYGINVRSFLHVGMTDRDIAAAQGQIAQELEKDDRNERVTVEIVLTLATKAMRIRIFVEPADESGDFEMVLAVTSADVLLEAIEGG